MARPECLFDHGDELGEGPVWDARQQTLLWVDILAGRLLRAAPQPAAPVEILGFGRPLGCAVPHVDGSTWLALSDGVWRLAAGAAQPTPIAQPPQAVHGPQHRFNDGKCDALGRFWLGTTLLDEAPGGGRLYRLDLDGQLQQVLDGITVSNGLGWSPDNRTFYYIDSPTRRVRAFDFDLASGQLGRGRTLIDFGEQPGVPDGLAVDSEGALWIAHWDGYRLSRWSADGELLAWVELPVARVTSCAFYGERLEQLLITTARVGLDESARQAQPLAGRSFRLDPGVTGLAVSACRVRVPQHLQESA